MTDRFYVRHPLYPIVSILTALLTLIGSLALARSVWGSVFVAAVFVLLCLFGYASTCLRALPVIAVYLAVFSLIFYLASGGNAIFTWQMANRLAGVAVAVLPGLSMPPVRLTRCLTALGCPRLLTLGMLITTSFVPVLSGEIRQVRSAMRTRGVTSLWNATAFYRAFLIPLLVRLVNISDTLALSVETRGFVSQAGGYTVYHPVRLTGKDLCFAGLFLAVLVCGLTAPLLGLAAPVQGVLA